MKKLILFLLPFCFSALQAQQLEKMVWFNPPEKWKVENKALSLFVTPKTDYWRITHYGFTVDDGPFYYTTLGGEFEVTVKLTGEYKSRFDQMGLMLRVNEKTWVKSGIEYVDGTMNVSAVVTHDKSDWSILPLKEKPKYIWIKALRKLDAVEISYSLDGKDFRLIRIAYFPDNTPTMVGMTAASPDGSGFNALFEEFQIKYLPDERRTKWLEKNK